MSAPDEPAKSVKTLGIRLKPDVHAQLSFIAQLRDGTITDEIQIAIAEHIRQAKADPELLSKADAAREAIEREAAARREAIATLFNATPDTAPSPAEPSGERAAQKTRPARRGQKGSDSDDS